MGTNFYWKTGARALSLPTGDSIALSIDDGDPRIHIGKRSAAGLYCWDCGVTLCAEGEERIHYSQSRWHDACPKCGKRAPERDRGIAGPVAVELGFAQPAKARPVGVAACASFSWAQDPERARKVCEAKRNEVIVVNEYGDELTGGEFLAMLEANCPVQSTQMIGSVFF